jgi:uncharacterized protein (DUF1778 family)
MARPRKSDSASRSLRLIVRLTDEEMAAIRAAAQAAGLRVSEFIRRAALDRKIVVRQESAYGVSLAHQLRHLGINLNQLTKLAHVNGEFPRDLDSALRKVELLLDRIIRVS